MKNKGIFLTAALASLLSASSADSATIIPSGGITATAGSVFGPNDARFVASNTLDGIVTEGNRDSHQGTHWLALEGNLTETITFDLGGSYALSNMEVLNTSNTNWNDSETDTFTIAYSTDGVTYTAPSAPIALQDFDLGFQTVSLTGTASHVQLVVTNSGVVDGNHLGANAPNAEARVGLNEVRFFQVPEPSAGILGAFGALLLLRRRRR